MKLMSNDTHTWYLGGGGGRSRRREGGGKKAPMEGPKGEGRACTYHGAQPGGQAGGQLAQQAWHLTRVLVDGAECHAAPGNKHQLSPKLLLLPHKAVDLRHTQTGYRVQLTQGTVVD